MTEELHANLQPGAPTVGGGVRPLLGVKKGKLVNKALGAQDEPLIEYVDRLKEQMVAKLPPEALNEVYVNCLLVLDDVVTSIKAQEFSPMMTQLFFNRRHLIAGGMLSIALVSQKYTMIPARIRSTANWLILFRLNPADFNTVYEDAMVMPQQRWRELLAFVFGSSILNAGDDVKEFKATKNNELGVWVEQDIVFQNFKRIVMDTAGATKSTS